MGGAAIMGVDGLTPEQRRAVRAPGSVAVTAGAGTGKTHMLTERYVHHVEVDNLSPLQIVAATFTDRAAAELRSRIRARLRSGGASADVTAELEAAQIGTLHALAGRICREHPEAAGVSYDFALPDPIQQRLWRERHLREALAELPESVAADVPYETLVPVLRALLGDPYTAERALSAEIDLSELIHAERRRVFADLARQDAWRDAVATLTAHRGPDDDKMEQQRAAAVAAVAAFAEGRWAAEDCEAVDKLHAGRGSKKAWDEATLQTLKTACSTLRDLYREGRAIFTLEPGEADERLARAQRGVREAWRRVRARLDERKRQQGVLDFDDLERHALRALENSNVQSFYATRWKAFLIDEFQDTNPVQAELLERLMGNATVTVVGDEKQSIYGFRRADVGVFRAVRERIRAHGGDVLELARSFRTHGALVEATNIVVRPGLADLHQSLAAARERPPGEGPYLSVHLMTSEQGDRKPFRLRAEAHRVGEIVQRALQDDGVLVHDKAADAVRPARPGDIAILARSWDDLEPFGAELAARGIPAIHAGGGDLFGQREAKDALALLRFLADPEDDISLVAVLRSPFFAIDDATLTRAAQEVRRARRAAADAQEEEDRPPLPWWHVLGGMGPSHEQASPVPAATGAAPSGALHRAVHVLRRLLAHAGRPLGHPAGHPWMALAANDEGRSDALGGDETAPLLPSALLAEADVATGYTAAIASLPGGPRRLADWRGVVDVVATLENGHEPLLSVVRQLGELTALDDAAVPRPALEAGDAVALMTVHNAKGLEWPIVIVPDITGRGGGNRSEPALFEPDAGVAFKVWSSEGEKVEPALYTVLKERARARDDAEEMRVLYVALTRARDRLYLTANADAGGKLERLRRGLEEAGIEPLVEPYDPDHAVPGTPRSVPLERAGAVLLDDVGPGLTHLPVTSLGTYAVCPKRFEFEVVGGHPGAPSRAVALDVRARVARAHAPPATAIVAHPSPESRILDVDPRLGARIGTLTHRALELGLDRADELAKWDPSLGREVVEHALALAKAYRTHATFAGIRGRIEDREARLHFVVPEPPAPTASAPRAGPSAPAITLHGIADAVGPDFVLDFKTGAPGLEGADALQVAAYARALDKPRGYIAYLRTEDEGGPELVEVDEAQLGEAMERTIELVGGIRAGDFDATPEERRCAWCAFEAICAASALRRAG